MLVLLNFGVLINGLFLPKYPSKTAIELCENGINLQYAVYINNKRYRPMSSFGKKINLNDEIEKQKFNYLID